MTTDPEMETKIYVFDHTVENPDVTSIPTPGPTQWSTLACFCSQLVVAGGAISRMKATDELWSLRDDGRTWEQPFPTMLRACWGASALSSGDHLLIAGGVGSDHPLTPLDTVQIYNVNTDQWVLSKPLPRTCYFMKSTLHDSDWYLAGGRWQYSTIFHASLESLIETSDIAEREVWKSLPELSQRRCCSILECRKQLLAVGGVVYSGPVREIQVYSTKKPSWVDVALLPRAYDSVCTTLLPKGKILLIGGDTLLEYERHNFSNCITKATINVINTLDDEFSSSALKHIEITAGISVYNSFLCGQMDVNDHDEWLLSVLKSTSERPATWRDLLRYSREKGMLDMANDIESIFTAKPLPESLPPSPAHGSLPLTSHEPGDIDPSPERKQINGIPTQEKIQDTKLEREFELKEELGRGAFGVVYHVKNKFDHGEFALKITMLPPSKHQQDKVMREVHALVTMDHSRVLRYYTSWPARVGSAKVLEALKNQDSPIVAYAELSPYNMSHDPQSPDPHPEDEVGSSEQKLPYCLHILTQLCNKETLKDWLENNINNRQKKTVLGIFEQILDAVVYIHSKGLLHRDLKPSNVFFSLEGGSIKVGDFGLVSGTTKHEEQQKQSHSGPVGSRFYVAPEQWDGKKYDKKNDVYALGVIFFELNCPFTSQEQRRQALLNLHNEQKLPEWFLPKLSHQAQLIECLLATDRPTANEILEEDHFKALKKESEQPEAGNIPQLNIPLCSSPGTRNDSASEVKCVVGISPP